MDIASAYIAGNDISPSMQKIAKDRTCYSEIKEVDFNKKALPYHDNEFDIVTYTGTMTYFNPESKVLGEFF